MAVFLQILFINLAVSCDNVGVIALAVRNLPEKKAHLARLVGVWLSLVLKLLFICLVSILFDISWLHIRIVGGALLLYVTFNMLRQAELGHSRKLGTDASGGEHFFTVLVSIIAADISMSLDNVIAILSIVSADGSSLGWRELLTVAGSLIVCVPVLLWFSGTVSRLMERFHLLIYICGGYLVYTAMKMIFADTTLLYFFEQIHFHLTGPAAVLCGVMVVLYGLLRQPRGESAGSCRNTLLLLCACVVVHTLVSLAGITYLSTNPVIEGWQLTLEMVYGVALCGGNAVYTIGEAFSLFTICSAVYTGTLVKHHKAWSYFTLLRHSAAGLLLFLLLELAVATAGLSASFGFGQLKLATVLPAFGLLLLLLLSYNAVFCLICTRARNQFACIALGLIYIWIEHVLAEACMINARQFLLARFFPSYYVFALAQGDAVLPSLYWAGSLLSAVIILACTVLSTCRWNRRLVARPT